MGAKGKDVEKRIEKLGKKVKKLDARLAELEKAAKEAKRAKKAEKARESAGGVPDAAPATEIAADAPPSPEVETREDD
jgi:septal ring factor EnvC (AmiA/AmiB activator)